MPHAQNQREFNPSTYPDFPTSTTSSSSSSSSSSFPTVPLETISLSALLSPETSISSSESERVFSICKGRGFFYLDLTGGGGGSHERFLQNAERIGELAEDVFKLPMEEKLKYRYMHGGHAGSLDGYKIVGETVTDKSGTRDTAEFFNVGKNEMLRPDDQMKRSWPAIIKSNKGLFREYITTAHGIGMTILSVIAEKLGVDPEEFTSRHRIEEESGDHVRLTRGPPREKEEMPEIQTPSHTDFGTITVLMNWLGGLQVWSESARQARLLNHEPDVPGEWLWVKPKKGCAIINLGDAAVKFTNGVLCAGRHRVIPAPGIQGTLPRYSIVYFVRPESKAVMKQIRGPGIPDGPEEERDITAGEWIKTQAAGLGVKWEERADKEGE